MAESENKNYYPAVGIPLDKLKPKKVRKNIELTLWERLYLFEVARGITVTTKHFIQNMIGFVFAPKGKKRRIITVYYPEEKVTLPPAYRGRPVLVTHKDGIEKCVACGLCEKICPAKAIKIIAAERDNRERYPANFSIDMARCVFCGFCEEVCPKEAIVMSAEYEGLAHTNRSFMKYPKEMLLRSEKNVTERIDYIRRIYSKCN